MYLLNDQLIFPDPHQAPDHGLAAIGGDLSTERLLLAYRSGFFPWYNDGEPICWWTPDPRMVFDLSQAAPMKLSKSLKQSKRNRGYSIKMNTCFEQVMRHCMKVPRPEQDGTWINEELISAYVKLHQMGKAKSVEVFKEDQLVGGLYGVDVAERGIFCGESMFSTATDASKIALWYLVELLQEQGYRYIDAQVYNDHLARLGAIPIDRSVFLSALEA